VQSKNNNDRRSVFWLVYLPRAMVVLVLLALSIGIFALMMMSRSKGEKKPPETNAVLVRTIEAIHRPSARLWSGYGTARTMESADIVGEVGGRVIERPEGIEPGSHVEAGELIVRLDDSDNINALDSARQAAKSLEAQIDGLKVESEQMQLQVTYASQEIEAATRDLDRIDQAIAAGAGSPSERDVKLASLLRAKRQRSVLEQQLDLIPTRRARLESQLSAQRASERIAQQNVDRASIRAPFAGEIQSVTPRVGDWVALGSVVARVVDLSRLEIPLKVPASSSSWLATGDEVRLWVRQPDSEPDQIGKVVRIAPEAESSSRTMTVFVEVNQDPNEPSRLLPGQFIDGRVVTHDPHPRVILPRRAVQSNRVFVARPSEDGGRVIEVVPVRVAYSFEASMPEIDRSETQWVALELGYEPVEHTQIVVSLLDQLIEGMRVRIAVDGESSSPSGSQSGTPSGVEP